MKRDDWTFQFTASKLAEAAATKKANHAERLKWWEEKKAETMRKVSETGIEVHESVAAGYSNTMAGYGPEITIDVTLQRDLTECQRKIKEHGEKVRDYEGWFQVLTGNAEARVALDHDDYLFFFGA